MREEIQQLLCKLYTYTYFRRIVHINLYQEEAGQMLVLSHRNGVIDGYVYRSVFQNARFLLVRQLQRNAVLRFLLPAIDVSCPEDKNDLAQYNISVAHSCVETVRNNQFRLAVFPQEESHLGPKPLPLQTEYAKMAAMAAQEKSLRITPCAIVYDDPTRMGGQVFVVQGKSVVVTNNMNHDQIHQQVSDSLNQVVISYQSSKTQLVAHQGAILAMLSGRINYAEALYKIGENPDILNHVHAYCQNPILKRCLCYKKCPVFPSDVKTNVKVMLMTMAIVIPTLMLNIVPIITGLYGSSIFADDENTISLWRTIMGYACAVLFYVFLLFVSPTTFLIGLPMSIWGFHLYGAFKKHMTAVLNHVICPKGEVLYKEIQNEIISKIM